RRRRSEPSAPGALQDPEPGGEALAHAGDAEERDAGDRPAHAGNPARARVQRRRHHAPSRAGRGVSGRIGSRRDGAIGWLTFDNPERRNAVSVEMWQAIPEVLEGFAADAALRGFGLTRAGGKAVISGGA